MSRLTVIAQLYIPWFLHIHTWVQPHLEPPSSYCHRKRNILKLIPYEWEINNLNHNLYSGTHTASTAVGRAVGVAKDANLVAVRILDCTGSGTISDTIAGLDWIASRHRLLATADGGASSSPGVVIMSLGVPSGTWAQSLASSVQSLIKQHGVSVVVASGMFHSLRNIARWLYSCIYAWWKNLLQKDVNPCFYHSSRPFQYHNCFYLINYLGNAKSDSCSVVPANVPETITVAASNLVCIWSWVADLMSSAEQCWLKKIYKKKKTKL